MKNNEESKLMAKEICHYISDRRDKKEISLLKDKPKKEKGGINTRLLAIAKKVLEKSNNSLKILESSKRDKNQTVLEFQKEKYKKLLVLLDEQKLSNQVIDITNEYKKGLLVINQEHQPNIWLNQWADKARDISFATHVGKLTHSSSKSSSVFDKTISKNSAYLTTNTLDDLMVDTATANAASAPAGEILTLKINNKTLLDYIKENKQDPFDLLSGNQTEVKSWMTGFKQAYDSDKKSSHFLAKQIYFPIDDKNYHLLMPLVSSSIAHTLFSRFKEFFNDENELIREQKKKDKYHQKPAVSYPNRASLNVTGSNHSNASSLNGKRGGKLTLLANMPPKWKSNQQFSLKQNNLLNKTLSYKLSDEIKELQHLLLVIKSKEVSYKKPVMHNAIVKNVNEIANSLFDEVIRINLLINDKGWTQQSNLPLSQQLLLEPYRDDEIAVQEKIKKQWQSELADDFSYWLNKQLKHKKLALTPIQQALWRDIFKQQLREFIALQEVVL